MHKASGVLHLVMAQQGNQGFYPRELPSQERDASTAAVRLEKPDFDFV
jgi:hypothetical protein